MARDLSAYRDVAVHLVKDVRTGQPRLQPMPGQAYATTMRVQCGRRLYDYPLGSCFLLLAKMTDRMGGEPFLYAYHGDPVQELSPEAAKKFLGAYRRVRI